MRQKLGISCMTLGLVFLAGAIALVFYNQWDDNRAGEAAAEIQSELVSVIYENADTDGSTADTSGTSDAESEIIIDENTEEIYAVSLEMDTVEIDGNDYIGTLTIPSLDLELPIMAEWSYEGLKITPGRYSGSVWTDDLILCGHNYTRHFGKLRHLEAGDTLYFTDVNGNVFYYEVREVVTLQPTAIEEMKDQSGGEWDLTLFTCTLGGQTRVTVRCIRTD